LPVRWILLKDAARRATLVPPSSSRPTMITCGPFGFECYDPKPNSTIGHIEIVSDVHTRGMFDDWPARRFRRFVMNKELCLSDIPRGDLLKTMQHSFESPFTDCPWHWPCISVDMVQCQDGECRRSLDKYLRGDCPAGQTRSTSVGLESNQWPSSHDCPATATTRARRTI
jgi:hypothetical protein